jgi:hypothetical protein
VNQPESKTHQSPILSVVIIATTLAALVGTVWVLVLAAQVAPSLVASLITGLLAIGGLVLGRMHESRKRIEEARRTRLAPIYERVLKMIYTTFKSRASEKKSIQTFEELAQLLMLWGTPTMVRAFIACRTEIGGDDPRHNLKALERLLLAIRKDLGSGAVNEGELLRIFLNDYDDVMAADDDAPPPPTALREAA